ncbi:MAG: pantetheine-phosphate adenylyltransferase [bacterium]
MQNIAVYPGTFDPLTLGHLDLISRSAEIFDQVVVAVAARSSKTGGMFTIEERLAMAHESTSHLPNVVVETLTGLLVAYCVRRNIRIVIRGLRAYSDFEYEFQMALTNRKLAPDVETLFMMPLEEHSYVTASTVREVARYRGDTTGFVPPCVQRHIESYVQSHAEQLKTGGGIGDAGAFDR